MRTSKRQRLNSSLKRDLNRSNGEFDRPATDDERHSWGGWCEVESEPAFFNVMLKQMGVRGVKVREIVSLDTDMLQSLPHPVYGLVFLFKWIEDQQTSAEEEPAEGVWFANQTVNNACATIALLNILNNVEGINLGEHLQRFKDFTSDLPPSLRGDALGNFRFVKDIHNSFARRMDMLNNDLVLKNEAESTARKSRKRKVISDEPGHHFNAFVPIDERLWQLDGLSQGPICLGNIQSRDWLDLVKPDLEARMIAYGDGGMDFAILSLVQDPIVSLTASLAANVKALAPLKTRLAEIDESWQALLTDEPAEETRENGFPSTTITGPDANFDLLVRDVENADIPTFVEEQLAQTSIGPLLVCRRQLIDTQRTLRRSIKAEQLADRQDDEKASTRRHDYAPAIQKWLSCHARDGTVINQLADA